MEDEGDLPSLKRRLYLWRRDVVACELAGATPRQRLRDLDAQPDFDAMIGERAYR